jgi:hypothetical protein
MASAKYRSILPLFPASQYAIVITPIPIAITIEPIRTNENTPTIKPAAIAK